MKRIGWFVLEYAAAAVVCLPLFILSGFILPELLMKISEKNAKVNSILRKIEMFCSKYRLLCLDDDINAYECDKVIDNLLRDILTLMINISNASLHTSSEYTQNERYYHLSEYQDNVQSNYLLHSCSLQLCDVLIYYANILKNKNIGNILFFKGSRSMRLEEIIKKIKGDF